MRITAERVTCWQLLLFFWITGVNSPRGSPLARGARGSAREPKEIEGEERRARSGSKHERSARPGIAEQRRKRGLHSGRRTKKGTEEERALTGKEERTGESSQGAKRTAIWKDEGWNGWREDEGAGHAPVVVAAAVAAPTSTAETPSDAPEGAQPCSHGARTPPIFPGRGGSSRRCWSMAARRAPVI